MTFFVEVVINIVYFFLSLYLPSKLSGVSIEVTRKISHILCGNWIFISAFINQYFFTNILVIVLMIILMILSYKHNIFKGVERPGQAKSYGTVYFFISIFIYLIYYKLNNLDAKPLVIFFLPLIYGDAFAAIIGEKMKMGRYKIFKSEKSIAGNAVMFIVSTAACITYNTFFLGNYYTIFQIVSITMIATIVEAVSVKGTDNFTIPIVTMILLEATKL